MKGDGDAVLGWLIIISLGFVGAAVAQHTNWLDGAGAACGLWLLAALWRRR